jgi:MoxR-like ATPase
MVVTRIDGVQAQINTLRNALNGTFPEREDQVEGILLALLSKEHVVLLGPPGTAKSLATRRVAQALGMTYFETLLSRFTTPPEIFGPMSLSGLEHDRVEFVTKGMLPEAEIAFIDEIFKAGSALLNVLLPLINERTFFNGTLGPQTTPLRTVIAASNEMPQGDGMEALWDRFLLRYEVRYVNRKDSFRKVMLSGNVDFTTTLAKQDLEVAQAAAEGMAIPDAVIDALYECRQALNAEGIVISDRRWKKSLRVAQSFSWLNGGSQVEATDLMVLQNSLWREPKERSKVSKVLSKILDSDVHTMCEILDAARETLKAYKASPQGVKESASFGKTLRAMKDKADGMAKKAPEKRRSALAPMVTEVHESWREVIRQAAESAGIQV